MEDVKQFRQWGAMTPGHPENFVTPGVEVTTGRWWEQAARVLALAVGSKHRLKSITRPVRYKIARC